MSEPKAKRIDTDRFRIYLAKAEEFFKVMKYAEAEGLWIAAGLNAIHCAISSCDALTTFYLGYRSIGYKHEDVILLLRKINIPHISTRIDQLLSILAVKNLVEYEAREFRHSDASRVIVQAERLFLWVKQELPSA